MALQVTSGSQREKWVAAFIPAAAILLVGFLYITFYALPAFNETEKEFQGAVGGGVGLNVIADLEAKAQQLRDDRTELQRTISSFDDEVTARSEAFQRLTETSQPNLAATADAAADGQGFRRVAARFPERRIHINAIDSAAALVYGKSVAATTLGKPRGYVGCRG